MPINQRQKEFLADLIGLNNGSLSALIDSGAVDTGSLIFYLECSISQPGLVFLQTLDKLYKNKSHLQSLKLIERLKLINDLCFNNDVKETEETVIPALMYWFGSTEVKEFSDASKMIVSTMIKKLTENECKREIAKNHLDSSAAEIVVANRIDLQKKSAKDAMHKSVPESYWRQALNLPSAQMPSTSATQAAVGESDHERQFREFAERKMREFNAQKKQSDGLQNDIMRDAYKELHSYGVTQEHLKLWRRLSNQHWFAVEHKNLLKFLVTELSFQPEQAILEMIKLGSLQAGLVHKYYNKGMRLEHFKHWQANDSFTDTHANTLSYLIDGIGLSPDAAMKEINLLNDHQAYLLHQYYARNLRGDDLRAWDSSQAFTMDHQKILDRLISKNQLEPQKALQEINGLNLCQATALANLYSHGLRNQHFKMWDNSCPEFTLSHQSTLNRFIENYKFSPENAMKEILKLNEFQAKALSEFYAHGLRGEHLRSWVGIRKGDHFTEEHLKALIYLVDVKKTNPIEAISLLNEYIYSSSPSNIASSSFFSSSSSSSPTQTKDLGLKKIQKLNELKDNLTCLDEIFKDNQSDLLSTLKQKIPRLNKIAKSDPDTQALFNKVQEGTLFLTRTTIIDVLMDDWFRWASFNLMDPNTNPYLGRLVIRDVEFYPFAQNLAEEMHLADLTQITHGNSQIWSRYFMNNDPAIARGRNACPLVKEGGAYQFAHPSLLKYFVARKMYTRAVRAGYDLPGP